MEFKVELNALVKATSEQDLIHLMNVLVNRLEAIAPGTIDVRSVWTLNETHIPIEKVGRD